MRNTTIGTPYDQLVSLFPTADSELLISVLAACNDNLEQAVEALLSMNFGTSLQNSTSLKTSLPTTVSSIGLRGIKHDWIDSANYRQQIVIMFLTSLEKRLPTDFADVILVSEDGHEFMCHKFVLSVRSAYFAAILDSADNEVIRFSLFNL